MSSVDIKVDVCFGDGLAPRQTPYPYLIPAKPRTTPLPHLAHLPSTFQQRSGKEGTSILYMRM